MIPSAGDPAAPRSLCTPLWWPQTRCVQGYVPRSVSAGLRPPSVVVPVLIVGAGLRQNLSPWPVLSSSLLSPAGIPTGLVSEPSEHSVSLRF